MKKRFNIIILSFITLSTMPLLADQICYSTINESTPTDNFTINVDSNSDPDGTVTDNSTGLMWMRCTYGQTWDVDTGSCGGTPSEYTWSAALVAAEAYSSADDGFADYSDWRLPNIKELTSIVEEACSGPALNTTLFPGYKGDYYWSASPYAKDSSDAGRVHFYTGDDNEGEKIDDAYVRLVRAGQ